jgi:hypothetical protein
LTWKERFFGSLLLKNKEQKTSSSLHDERTCPKCKETKPLNLDHFQQVKSFKTGFSYYCNSCDKPIKIDE